MISTLQKLSLAFAISNGLPLHNATAAENDWPIRPTIATHCADASFNLSELDFEPHDDEIWTYKFEDAFLTIGCWHHQNTHTNGNFEKEISEAVMKLQETLISFAKVKDIALNMGKPNGILSQETLDDFNNALERQGILDFAYSVGLYEEYGSINQYQRSFNDFVSEKYPKTFEAIQQMLDATINENYEIYENELDVIIPYLPECLYEEIQIEDDNCFIPINLNKTPYLKPTKISFNI